jgi:hypothetical protein
MHYNKAIRTAIRHATEGSGHIAGSMVNQVQRCEGDKAAREFAKEVQSKSSENRRKQFYT